VFAMLDHYAIRQQVEQQITVAHQQASNALQQVEATSGIHGRELDNLLHRLATRTA